MRDWWKSYRAATAPTWACRGVLLATGVALACVQYLALGKGLVIEGLVACLGIVAASLWAALVPDGGASWFVVALCAAAWLWLGRGRVDGLVVAAALLLLANQVVLGWLCVQPGWLPEPPGTWRRRAVSGLLLLAGGAAGVGLVAWVTSRGTPGFSGWSVAGAAALAVLVWACWRTADEVDDRGSGFMTAMSEPEIEAARHRARRPFAKRAP